jgi:hypothetical protein
MKPTLTFDAEKHEYRLGRQILPSVTQVLNSVGITDFEKLERVGVDMETARERGSTVHLITQLHDEGTLDPETVDPELAGYLEAWSKFREISDVTFDEDGIERMVCSADYRYAGTVDRVGHNVLGKRIVIDIKTGTPLAATGLQLAAYEHTLGEDRAMARIGVYLRKDGTFTTEIYDDPSDWPTFLYALFTHHWKESH